MMVYDKLYCLFLLHQAVLKGESSLNRKEEEDGMSVAARKSKESHHDASSFFPNTPRRSAFTIERGVRCGRQKNGVVFA